jgi:hypothetical protein
MHVRFARIALLLSLSLAAPASADELADFNAAVEQAAAHQRVAIGYLRTGNIDLAGLEIERMRAAWGAVNARYGKPPQALARDPQLYTTTMLDVATRLVAASIMLDSGRPEAAQNSLNAIRVELTQLRKANGIVVLADCIGNANAAMDRLMIYNDAALDWNKPEASPNIANQASAYQHELDHCDAMAAKSIKDSPEFRRLIDGAKASLAQIPQAVSGHDTNLLHRLLIELRSFDNLLAFRFG